MLKHETRGTADTLKPFDSIIALEDLVSRSDVHFLAIDMNSLCDIRGLLLQGHQHITRLIIKTCRGTETGGGGDKDIMREDKSISSFYAKKNIYNQNGCNCLAEY